MHSPFPTRRTTPPARFLLVLCLLALFPAPVAAQRLAVEQGVFLPLVATEPQGELIPPVSAIDELPPIGSDLYLYPAVHSSPTADKHGDVWVLVYPIRNPEPGPRLGIIRQGSNRIEYLSGRLSNGPRGDLYVGCDGVLYALIYDESDKYVLRLYRINAYPGPPYPTSCTPRSEVMAGWKVVTP